MSRNRPGPFDYARKTSMRLWFFAAFVQMGFPIIFQPAVFDCP